MKLRLEYAYATAFVISIFQIIIFFTSLELEVDGWGKNAPRDIILYVANTSTQLIPKNLCQKESLLLIVVSSAPSNAMARQAVRKTWGSQHTVLEKSITLVFFLGNSLEPSVQNEILIESRIYNDIIQEDFVDSYYNLTLKSVLMLKVAINNCLDKAAFLLKTDDDMFVNVPRLMRVLIDHNNSENVLLGRMMCGTKPIKDPFSKWYCPKYMYNKTYFPNFLSGTGYVMSMDVTQKLYNAALNIPLIHLEDVYITGLCAEYAGIVPEFNMEFTAGGVNDEPCELKNLITMHQFPPKRMKQTFEILNDPGLFEKCSDYEPMFEVKKWIKSKIFMPISRMQRTRICQ